MAEIGHVLPVLIQDEMRKSYIDYSMSVIVARALPDVRDGLKPVHRRILYAMQEANNTPDHPYKKSARIVGDVMGKYHPHGDSAIYDAMVRLAQDFSTRYLLVDGHGNFGSVDGDPPAAARYTEVRLTKIAVEMLRDIEKKTVEFSPNFDEELTEPQVLPSRYPNLLVNGSSGIAVGMATNIPPHQLGEVIDGTLLLLRNSEVADEDILALIKGPDFPTGGLIVGHQGIQQAYRTGRGIITMRSTTDIEMMNNGKSRIIVTEIPYQVNKSRLIERIAELVREKKIEGITDLRDESNRKGMKIVIELKREANAKIVLNQLFKHTSLQQTFGVIMLSLVNGQPRLLTLRQMLHYYIEHQKEIIVRRTQFDLDKAEARAHILEGLKIALDHLDEVIRLIRSSPDVKTAREGLISQFQLTEIQANAILDMRLQRLTALERDKIEQEYAEVLKTIERLRAILGSESLVREIIAEELLAIKAKYNDDRRTLIIADEGEFADEDLIPDEDCVISMTHQGYIKRLPLSTYKAQRRGGRGIAGMATKEEDVVERLFVTTTHKNLLFFTTRGRVYHLKVYQLPESGRTAKGTAIVNLLSLSGEEKVTAVITVDTLSDKGFLFMATRKGVMKKTAIAEFAGIRISGLNAISLDDDDELFSVRKTDGDEELIMVTRKGIAIRFRESDVRAMGRTAHGVLGPVLASDDRLVAMEQASVDQELFAITEKGYGKRTPIKDYRLTNRRSKGVKAINVTAKNGMVATAKVVQSSDDLMIISAGGIVIRVAVLDISLQGRAAQGVTVMRLGEDDHVVALAKITPSDEVEEEM